MKLVCYYLQNFKFRVPAPDSESVGGHPAVVDGGKEMFVNVVFRMDQIQRIFEPINLRTFLPPGRLYSVILMFVIVSAFIVCSHQQISSLAEPFRRTIGIVVQGPPVKGIFRDAECLVWALNSDSPRPLSTFIPKVTIFYTLNYALLDQVMFKCTDETHCNTS